MSHPIRFFSVSSYGRFFTSPFISFIIIITIIVITIKKIQSIIKVNACVTFLCHVETDASKLFFFTNHRTFKPSNSAFLVVILHVIMCRICNCQRNIVRYWSQLRSVLVCNLMIMVSVEEYVREDGGHVQDGSDIPSNLSPVERESVQFGHEHAGEKHCTFF